MSELYASHSQEPIPPTPVEIAAVEPATTAEIAATMRFAEQSREQIETNRAIATSDAREAVDAVFADQSDSAPETATGHLEQQASETREVIDDAEKIITMLRRDIDGALKQQIQMETEQDRFRGQALNSVTEATNGLKRLYSTGNQRLNPMAAKQMENELTKSIHYARGILQVENARESALHKPMMGLRQAARDERFDENRRNRFGGHAKAIDTYVRRQGGVDKAGHLLRQLNMVAGNIHSADVGALISQLTRLSAELTQQQTEKHHRGGQPDELTILLKDIQKELAEL